MSKKSLAEDLKKQSEKYGFPTIKINKPKKSSGKSSES